MIHIFCPHFTDLQGEYRFSDIPFDEVSNLLANGYWLRPDPNEQNYALDRSLGGDDRKAMFADMREREGDLVQIAWRHAWAGVRDMLINHSPCTGIPRDVTQKKFNWRRPMAVGDLGIVFRGAGQVDFRSKTLRPADFDYILVERIC